MFNAITKILTVKIADKTRRPICREIWNLLNMNLLSEDTFVSFHSQISKIVNKTMNYKIISENFTSNNIHHYDRYFAASWPKTLYALGSFLGSDHPSASATWGGVCHTRLSPPLGRIETRHDLVNRVITGKPGNVDKHWHLC